jgi:hypothetical protein
MNGPQYTFDNPCGDVKRAEATLAPMGLLVSAGPDPKRVLVSAANGGQVESAPVAIALSNLAAVAEATVTASSTTEVTTPATPVAPVAVVAPAATVTPAAPSAVK